ncbi:MAG: transcriptional repressor LexA [Chitinivibrionales bacterium]
MKPLTPEQSRVFAYIVACRRDKGMPPTVREIAKALGYKSPNNVRQHLRLIEQKGYVRLLGGRARGIEVTVSTEEHDSDQHRVPLVGSVAAGKPVTAVENLDGYITLDKSIFRGEGLFTLRIKGDSMEGIGVLDGDIVVVRRQSTANNNDIVVAIIDDEATLKRFIRKPDHIILRPENPKYADIIVGSDREVAIAGKMVGLMRKY